MKTYRSTETVDALPVNYLQGNAVSDKKKPKDKDLVVLPSEFVNHHTIRLSDVITFGPSGPKAVMNKAVFEQMYEEARPTISDEQAEADLATDPA